MQGFIRDIRGALRAVNRRPGIAGLAVLVIALGIGSTTTVFSLIIGILLRPLPYANADRLVAVWNALPGAGFDQFAQSAALHFTYEDQSQTVESIGLWTSGRVTITGIGEPISELGVWVTHGTLETLGVQPVVGRRFTPVDDSPSASCTVMLNNQYWHSEFGGQQNVVGQMLRVDGETCEIIGVTPEGGFPYDLDPAIYLALRIDRSSIVAGQFIYSSVARLAEGVSLETALADMTRLLPVHIDAFPGGITHQDMENYELAPILRPLKTDVLGNVGARLWVAFGVAALVLLIALANIANLALVQAEGRDREIAVRSAVGASRGRVAQQLLIEGLGLGLIGGFAGLVLAYVSLEVFLAINPGGLPRLSGVSIDRDVLLFALGLSVLSGIVFGLFPVMRSFRRDPVSALKEGGAGAGTGRQRHRTRNSLAAIQFAVALVLLVGSGLMVRSFWALIDVDPGYGEPEAVLTLQIEISPGEIPDLEEMARAHEVIGERISELPGVSSVGLTSKLPLSYGTHLNPIWAEGFSTNEESPFTAMQFTWVGGEFFETLQIPLLHGRYLTPQDARNRAPVMVVSESVALQFWASPAEAVGKRLSGGRTPGEGGWREVVGVVGDVFDFELTQDPRPTTYWPLITPNPWAAVDGNALIAPRHVSYAIRSQRVGTPDLLRAVKEAIASVNPNLAAQNVRMLDQILARGMARTTFMLATLGLSALVAVVLAIVGVYGVVSYVVSQRTRELALRMAVGAQPIAVVQLVLKQGLFLSASGVGLGLVGALWLSRLLGAFVFGVDPVDPATFVIAAISLVSTCLLACLLPAQRAARIDPNQALRTE
jgi:predicted permease